MNKTQLYILHGYTANADSHWFKWLEDELAKIGITSLRVNVPNSSDPNPEKWLGALGNQVRLDENSVIVGHSLGCITWLSFLAQHQQKVRVAVFVSGFYQPLSTLPELTPFANFYQNQTACLPEKSYVVAAFDDGIVPHHYSEALAEHLSADYIRLHKGGHFLDREGWTTFPLILELIKQLLGSEK